MLIMNLKIKLIKSRIGMKHKHTKILDALCLKKIGQEVTKPDNLPIKGMIRKVSYCLNVEEVS